MDQVEEERWVREAEVVADLTTNAPNLTPVATAVVAVGVGDGVRVGVGVAVFVGVGVSVGVSVGGTGVAVGGGTEVLVGGGGGTGVLVGVGAATHGGWKGSRPLVPVSAATGPAPVWIPPAEPSAKTPRMVAELDIPIWGPPQRSRLPCSEIVTELPGGRLQPMPEEDVIDPPAGLQSAPAEPLTPVTAIGWEPFHGL
jgi:hypothetical protein